MNKLGEIEILELKKDAAQLQSGLGAIAWATLEMFRRGGMAEVEVAAIKTKMDQYFAQPSNDVCNAVLKVVEARLQEDKEPATNLWY
jgi:hypothetical protein